ncbi:MAG: AMIN domain-containing protein [Terriglobales bacterium]
MKLPPRISAVFGVLSLASGFLWLLPIARAQSAPELLTTTEFPVRVRSVRGLFEPTGPAIEIISDQPVVPQIRTLDNPSRLVIDLPNATLLNDKKHLDFRISEVAAIRANQFQESPPVARIVVDLAKPVAFTWDAAGNRLMVRLRARQPAVKPAPAPNVDQAARPSAIPVSSASTGAIILAGSRVPDGASVTAGLDPSVLRLQRGGEVKVCPGTTISVTSSKNGRTLMLAMSTGALEAHYALDTTADSIVTPDFRILLAGPGEFDYGVSADSRGNTCIQALPGNTASVIVSELLGDGTYQVKPAEQVMFHSGQLRALDRTATATCGCPAPVPAVMLSSNAREQLETAPLPPSKPNDVHIQVDAPFVFNANDPPPPQPPPTHEAELLPPSGLPRPAWFEPAVLPPPQPAEPHRSVFGKIRHFFAAIFG